MFPLDSQAQIPLLITVDEKSIKTSLLGGLHGLLI